MELELATSGVFPDRMPIKDWAHRWAAHRANPERVYLLEEELRNSSNPSVPSPILLHFTIATETRNHLLICGITTNSHCNSVLP